MSSAFHPAVDAAVLETSPPRVRREAVGPGIRRPLSIAAAGTVLFAATVVLLSQLVSPLWVASHFAW